MKQFLFGVVGVFAISGCTTVIAEPKPVRHSIQEDIYGAVANHEDRLHAVKVDQIHALSSGEIGVHGRVMGANASGRPDVRVFGSDRAYAYTGYDRPGSYTVQRGDTLHGILTRTYGYADSSLIAEVCRLNNISPRFLRIGQVLYLP